MRITHISVKGLFGIFNHDIPLNRDERITIIYGPNGFGKTFTLSLVNELFNPGYDDFYRTPFSELAVDLDDTSRLCLMKQERDDGDILTFKHTAPDGATDRFVCGQACKDHEEPVWFKKLRDGITMRFVHTDRLIRIQKGLLSNKIHAVEDCIDEFRDTVAAVPETFDALIDNIKLLERIINSRFNHKRFEIRKGDGFLFTTSGGKILPAENLSSGEQHVVMMLYELLFKVEPDSLILVDEPELSLHILWQQQFVRDLQDIIRLAGFDVLIATHSPQIIHDRWDLTVELKGPE